MLIRRHGLIGAAALAVAAGARADTYPSKQIRWVIPFAPGGNYDVTSRLVAEPMGRLLGQSVLIDNRPGAGGVVGLDAAINAPADGYTIVMGSFTVGYVAPIFAGKQQMLQLLAPVSILTTAPTLIVTRADSRFADAKTLLAEVKAHIEGNADLKKQAADGWTRVLHFGDHYGTPYSRKIGQEFLDGLKKP